tara:strand:+ start:740 stop:1834 length:1095 start_codon:yes stop_codon:yes gene_type:complete
MANQNIRTPRFYVDNINYQLSRGVTQNGNFDVTATDAGATLMGTFTTGSEPELFDMRPLNICTFDTSADTDGHVLIKINKGDDASVYNYVAILNHNLASSLGKIRIFAGNLSSDIDAVDAGNVDVQDPRWDGGNIATEVVNADTITTGASNKSCVIQPAANGTTIFAFPDATVQYWAIQFEGADGGSGADTDETWGSTDLFIGGIMIGEYYDMPHAPELDVKKTIAFDKNTVQESIGGQRYSNMPSHGRIATSTLKSPFSVHNANRSIYGGRISYDMKFNYLASTDLLPNEYTSVQTGDDAVIEDVWNKTNGNHLPFIFSIDKDSTGNNAESEHIFARFGQNALNMTQVAPDVFNISMRIEEEF